MVAGRCDDCVRAQPLDAGARSLRRSSSVSATATPAIDSRAFYIAAPLGGRHRGLIARHYDLIVLADAAEATLYSRVTASSCHSPGMPFSD
jgi:hypothetical protein